MSWRTPEDHARETGPLWRRFAGLVRRVRITLDSTRSVWQMTGNRGGAGGDEVFDVEVFSGIGLYARPPADGAPEAIVVGVGGSKTSVAVATRDEKTRALVASIVKAGETCLYNAVSMVILGSDGSIRIGTISGIGSAPKRLAFHDELLALHNKFAAHKHTGVATGGGISGPPQSGDIPAAPTGTSATLAE